MDSGTTGRRFVRKTESTAVQNATSTKDPYFQLAEDAKYAASIGLGVREPLHPGAELPNIPSGLSDVYDSELMSLFVSFTRWSEYLSWALAEEEVKEDMAIKLVKRKESIFMLSAEGKTAADKKAQMENDPDILQAREQQEFVFAKKTFVKVLYENAVRGATLCSRELTRRVEMETSSRRTDNHG